MPSYRFLDEETSVENTEEKSPIKSKGNFRILEEEAPEGEVSSVFGVPFKDIARQGAQYTSRGLEALGGLPGNVTQFVKGIGESLPEVPEFLHGKQSFIQEKGGKLLEKLPTTSDIREATKQASSGFLEPQSETEEFFGNIIEDAASLRGGGFTGLRAIGTAFLGNASKPIVKEFGGGDSAQELAKAGTMLTSALINPGGAKAYGKDKFEKAYQSIKPGEEILANNIKKDVEKFLKEIQKGGMSPQKEHAFKLAKDLKKKASIGKTIEVDELPAFRKSINDFRFNKDLNDTAHKWLNDFDEIINTHLNIYGKTNPKFLENYREGNQIYSSLHQGSKIAKFIRKVTGAKELDPKTLALFSFHLQPGALGIAGGAEAGAQTISFFKRFANNPAFRRYYLETLRNATKSNAPGVLKNIEKLNDVVKDESENQ